MISPKEPSAKQLENIGVYDLNAKGWRSFKVSNVTDVQTTEEAHEELIETIKKPVRHYPLDFGVMVANLYMVVLQKKHTSIGIKLKKAK